MSNTILTPTTISREDALQLLETLDREDWLEMAITPQQALRIAYPWLF